MQRSLPQGIRTFCLIFGTVETFLGILWCLAGAGIYGSPLGFEHGLELAYLLGVLFTGPLSALPAAIVVLWKPRAGAIWLIVGAIASGILALASLTTGSHIAPIPGVFSLPMLVVGLWLLRRIGRKKGPGTDTEDLGELQERQTPGGIRSILVGGVFFLAAWIGTYSIFIALAINNVTGLRGPPLSHNPFVAENEDLADFTVLLLVAVIVSLATGWRRRLRLRGEVVAGMWAAALLGGLVILIR
jgi:hypothetical protein